MSRQGAKAAREQARSAALERSREIYRAILERSPEHDFAPTLDRIELACDLLGDPQKAYRVVHVAGTNGKTSTARMTETLIRTLGLRAGLFTSPHLSDVRERICIDGEPIDPESFVTTWDICLPIIEMVDERSREAGGPRMSFFEVLTLMAFVAFADAPVDVAVIEVGMGGTWDCTNVVESQVQVIGPIGMDHQRFLGYSIEEIAAQKAGIIAERGTAVVARQVEAASAVISDVVAEREARAFWAGQEFGVETRTPGVGGQMVHLRGIAGDYPEVFVPLFGEHQAENAALSLAAVELLLSAGPLDGGASAVDEAVEPLDQDVVREAFAAVTSPGRLEVVRTSPRVIVDAAHNAHGGQALVRALHESFPIRLVGLIGMMGDKEPEPFLGSLEPVLDHVVITRSLSLRAADVDDLADVARDVFGEDRVTVVDRLDDALSAAVELAEADMESAADLVGSAVLATGSIALVAEVRTLLGR